MNLSVFVQVTPDEGLITNVILLVVIRPKTHLSFSRVGKFTRGSDEDTCSLKIPLHRQGHHLSEIVRQGL